MSKGLFYQETMHHAQEMKAMVIQADQAKRAEQERAAQEAEKAEQEKKEEAERALQENAREEAERARQEKAAEIRGLRQGRSCVSCL